MIKRPLWLRRLIRRRLVRLFSAYAARRGRRGLAAIRADGDRFGRIHYALSPFLRRRLESQIARVLGRDRGDRQVRAVLRESWRINNRAVLEIMALSSGAVSAAQLAGSVRVTGHQALLEAADRGRGTILLGMHMGNVFALLIELARQGLPVSVIAYQSRKLPEGFFENMLADTTIQTIRSRPEFAAFYELNRAVKRGRSVFIPMDQIHKRGGVEAMFLDKRVPMPGGAAALARKHAAPVFPVFLDGAEPDWQFRIGEPVELTGPGGLPEDVARLTAIMDAHIRARPELWSWHQRRWHRHPFAEGPAETTPHGDLRKS